MSDPNRKPSTGIGTGFHTIDDLLPQGLRPGGVTLISGDHQSGRTAFCLSLALHVTAVTTADVLFVSLTDTARAIQERMISAEAYRCRVWERRAREYEPEGHVPTADLPSQRGLLNVAKSPMTLADLAPLLEVMTEGPSLIIIDDVQAICSDAPGSPAEGSAVTVLKLLAQKYKTHVVAVTDLVQSTEWMEDRYPSLDHLGSSDVEEADNVWLLYRPGMFGLTAPDGTNLDRAVQLTFEKSTEAEGWSIHLDFDPETGLCMEMAGLWV